MPNTPAHDIMRAQSGNRLNVTFKIAEPGARFARTLSSHYANQAEVDAKLAQLQAENPTATVSLI